MRYLDRLQPFALLVMRVALGVVMVAHGYQKVFRNLRPFAHMVAGMGLPQWLGYVAAFTELLGGLMILVGFFTRNGAVPLHMTPITPSHDGPIPFTFAISMGVRKNDTALLQQLDRAIAARQAGIRRILTDYRVPQL